MVSLPWVTNLCGLIRPDSEPLRLKDVTQLSGDLFEKYAIPFSPGNVPNAQHIFPTKQKDFVNLIM